MVENGQSFSSLEENDPLRLYLEELAGIPVCGDVQMLAQRYLEGEESVASQLTGLMLSRVVERAREHTGMGVLLLDLIQEASLGLWQGILHYTGGDMESHCDLAPNWRTMPVLETLALTGQQQESADMKFAAEYASISLLLSSL